MPHLKPRLTCLDALLGLAMGRSIPTHEWDDSCSRLVDTGVSRLA